MKKISRRSFLQVTGLAAGASMLPMPVKWLGAGQAEAFMQSPCDVPLYGQALRITEIPIAVPIPAGVLPGVGEGAQDDVADAGLGWALKFPQQFPPSPAPLGAPRTGVRHYTFELKDFQDQILPASCYPATGPGAAGTTLYGFKPALTLLEALTVLGVANPWNYDPFTNPQPQKHLGGIMLWEGGPAGKPVQFTMVNNLPLKHILPNDMTVPGSNQGDDRWTTHVHGGLMPWICDGGPFDWYCSIRRTSSAQRVGSSFINNIELQEGAARNSKTQGEFYMNPDKQSARMIWYHDHAFGITRLNAYAGAASAILIRDDYERNLKTLGLPPLIENSLFKILGVNPDPTVAPVVQEVPLVFQDKIFVGSNIKLEDPTWPGTPYKGSMWYPHTYEQSRWRRLPSALSMPKQSVVAEMFGDTMLVNGASSPSHAVEPRRYRFRLLNACNARFLNLQLYEAVYGAGPAPYVPNATGIVLDPNTNTPVNPPFVNAATGTSDWMVIGYEGGFLTKVAAVSCATPYVGGIDSGAEQLSLLLGSAERPDVIVDFSNYAGKEVILYNDAAGPFPDSAGDPRNDYMPGLNNGNVVNTGRNRPANDLLAHNTRCVMKFVVAQTPTAPADLPLALTPGFNLVGLEDNAAVPPRMWNMEPERFDQKADAAYSITGTTAGPGAQISWSSIDGTTIDRFNRLGLFEEFDKYGRLQQDVGGLSDGATAYTAAPNVAVDCPTNGNCEVWAIWNTTADVHPMHFHMSNWWIVGRQTQDNTAGSYAPTGPLMGPRPWEFGYKEVVLCYPGEVTYILDKWNIPPIYGPKLANPVEPAYSPRFPGADYHETVWHCHILEHEEHDMMRPVLIRGIASVPVTSPTRVTAPVVRSCVPNKVSLAAPGSITITGMNLGAATVALPGFTVTVTSQTATQIVASLAVNGATAGHNTLTVALPAPNGNKDFAYVQVLP